ncbi:hypothetical protein [Hoeflea poritis]|uniref:GGDEF domain-containing protein n=1 Tax=Hoeflea poritis TaxID=2993659 RepID=A0ABT4VQE5_9HYPH|nr:hypothetical protein [Hoeflea poritis]MDA4846916.1 hypothetical protein [Hoeflea poritis]
MTDIFFGSEIYLSAFRVFFNFFIVSLGVGIVFWILCAISHKPNNRVEALVAFWMILAVALLGGLTGYAGGNSRDGVVGDVIPAVLAFLSGAVLYFFGLERQPAKITPFLLGAFVVVLFLGFGMGAKKRQLFDDGRARDDRRLQTCIDVFSDAEVLASDTAVDHAVELFGERCDKVVDLSTYRR